MKARIEAIIRNRWLIFALRLVLGGVFILASIGKLQYQADFINTVIGYGILPTNLAHVYGLILPWVELFIGCTLVLGIFSRFTTALSIPLVISFFIASAYSLLNSVAKSCGCFGELIPLSSSASIVSDAVMLLMAVQLLLRRAEAEFLSIGSLLYRGNGLGRRERVILEKVSKLAIVALAIFVVIFLIGGVQIWLDMETVGVSASDNEGTRSLLDTELDKPALFFLYKGCTCDFESELAIIADLQDKYEVRVVFQRINYEKDPQVAQEFEVKTFPTVLLMSGKNDQGGYILYQRFDGIVDEAVLKESLEQLLGSGEADLTKGEG
jgi:putative oxidoreductase